MAPGLNEESGPAGSARRGTAPARVQRQGAEPSPSSEALIELLFFAYRDFVADADRVLETYGFGRAHHRVLHFVNRRPGLTIAELLGTLRITKQSLNRVLKDLIESGHVEQRAGDTDRRQRRLSVTEAGHALAAELAALQARRIERALSPMAASERAAAARFLARMADESGRS